MTAPVRRIILFDMDGVLLESLGYHRALQETVRMVALSLGLGDLTLRMEEIAAFEAVGMTSEWDEAAVASALLLLSAWQAAPELRLSPTLAPSALLPGPFTRPDFMAFARQMGAQERGAPLDRARHALLALTNGMEAARQAYLLDLVASARQADVSQIHRVFQELVLGSAVYEQTYQRPGVVARRSAPVESYLAQYDISNVSEESRQALAVWRSRPGHAAAILTARPSRPPSGVFGTPEAELGANLVGLADLPLAGWGSLSWLAARRRVDPQMYLKPAAVHALTAVQMALGEAEESALLLAEALAAGQPAAQNWQRLAGAEVAVFEDTRGGVLSLLAAQKVLAEAGIPIHTDLRGVSSQPIKAAALAAAGARVFDTFEIALRDCLAS